MILHPSFFQVQNESRLDVKDSARGVEVFNALGVHCGTIEKERFDRKLIDEYSGERRDSVAQFLPVIVSGFSKMPISSYEIPARTLEDKGDRECQILRVIFIFNQTL